MTEVWEEYKDRIAGSWKCIAFEMFSTGGGERKLLSKPHGDSPLGRAIISPEAYLSANVAQPSMKPPLPSNDIWETGSAEEIERITSGISGYSGFFKLYKDDQGGLYWQTKVDWSTDPSRLSGIQERKVIMKSENGKNYMILEPKQDMTLEDGTNARGVLTWEKFA